MVIYAAQCQNKMQLGKFVNSVSENFNHHEREQKTRLKYLKDEGVKMFQGMKTVQVNLTDN